MEPSPAQVFVKTQKLLLSLYDFKNLLDKSATWDVPTALAYKQMTDICIAILMAHDLPVRPDSPCPCGGCGNE